MKIRKLPLNDLHTGSVAKERKYVQRCMNILHGAQQRIKICVAAGSIGKTFKTVQRCLLTRINDKSVEPFTYIVDNDETRKSLTQDNGFFFWSRQQKFLNDVGMRAEAEKFNDITTSSKIISYKDRPIGYVLPYSFFSKFKYLNMVSNFIILDEFIPEELDYNNKKIAEKVQSLCQTIERDNKITCIMLANPKTLRNPLMQGMYDLKPGEYMYTKDKIAIYIDLEQCPNIKAMNMGTIAGAIGQETGVMHRLTGQQKQDADFVEDLGQCNNFICGKGLYIGVKLCPEFVYVSHKIAYGATGYCKSAVDLQKGAQIAPDVIKYYYNAYARDAVRYLDNDSKVAFLQILGIKE